MNELDNLLKTLRAEEPRPKDINRWKRAIQMLSYSRQSRWIELVAAMLVGIIIGGTLFKQKPVEENLSENATTEPIVTGKQWLLS